MSSRRTAAVLCLLASASPALAGVFYVAPPPSGNDANPGNQSRPWATLQHAADRAAAGDTVLVRAGGYAGAYLTRSGTAARPIVFQAFPGEEPRITADNGRTPDGFNLEGASHIVIDGFRVDGRTRAGIRAVLCEGVTIRNNRCDGNGRWGIFTGFCDDLLIEGNRTSNSVDEHGIYLSNSGDRPVIRGNRIWGNHANGIHLNGDRSQGGDGVISQALIEANVIWDNGRGGGSGINMDGVRDSIIRNNLIYDTHASGISLYRIDGGAPSTGNKVLNNTVIVASDGRWALNIQNGSSNNLVRNNILYSEHSSRGAVSISRSSLPGFSSDFNALEGRFTLDDGASVLDAGRWRAETGQDRRSVLSNPAALFVNAARDDYHLPAGSPAVDRGEARAEVRRDLEGRRRPQGSAYDIGAYERPGAPPPPPPPSPPPAPGELTAEARSASTIRLGWRDNADDETSQRIERRSGGGPFVEVAALSADVESYLDTGLVPAQTYVYRLRAENDGGFSPYSNRATATTPDVPPAAPRALEARTEGADSVLLEWRDASDNESRFLVERRLVARLSGGAGGGGPESPVDFVDGPFEEIAILPAGSTSWLAAGLDADALYGFRVRASNSAGTSAATREAPATTGIAGAPPPCSAGDGMLCLLGERFSLRVVLRNQRDGSFRVGRAVPGNDQSGFFWFFRPSNIELAVKMIDATPVTGSFWLFFGALSDVEYWVIATDSSDGRTATYRNPPGEICGQSDTRAFLGAGAGKAAPAAPAVGIRDARAPEVGLAEGLGSCAPGPSTLCLLDGRIRVEVDWHNQRNGETGSGMAMPDPRSDQSGFFWFFRPSNVELVTKVIDGRDANGHFWFFYGGLSDLEYTIRVTDTVGGGESSYDNPPGSICGSGDVRALPAGP